MDFTRTFEANTNCNNIDYVWSHFYQILAVLMWHRCLWNNIFDTYIFRCINTYIKLVYSAFFGMYMLLQMYSVDSQWLGPFYCIKRVWIDQNKKRYRSTKTSLEVQVVCVKKFCWWASMVLQHYQYFIEMTSNMIYIVAFVGGLKCLCIIHLTTQCFPPPLPSILYSRVRNKRSPTIINFSTFFQGLRPYSGLHSIR